MDFSIYFFYIFSVKYIKNELAVDSQISSKVHACSQATEILSLWLGQVSEKDAQ